VIVNLLNEKNYQTGMWGLLKFISQKATDYKTPNALNTTEANKLIAAALDCSIVTNQIIIKSLQNNKKFRITGSPPRWEYIVIGADINQFYRDAAAFLESILQDHRRQQRYNEAKITLDKLPVTYQTTSVLELMVEYWDRGKEYVESNIMYCMSKKPETIAGFLKYSLKNDGARDHREIEKKQIAIAAQQARQAAEEKQAKDKLSWRLEALKQRADYDDLRAWAQTELIKLNIPLEYQSEHTLLCFVESRVLGKYKENMEETRRAPAEKRD